MNTADCADGTASPGSAGTDGWAGMADATARGRAPAPEKLWSPEGNQRSKNPDIRAAYITIHATSAVAFSGLDPVYVTDSPS